jgi:hypothetical protein
MVNYDTSKSLVELRDEALTFSFMTKVIEQTGLGPNSVL